MSKLVTSDNLKAYHSELAEHLQLLERDKAYSVGDTVKYDGLTLKCTIAGNTDVNKVDYSSIYVGDTIVDGTVTFTVIDPNSMWYEEDKFYMVDDIVVYNDKFYKCITAHTATSTFDTTKWTEISAGGGGSSGGGISNWQANTDYEVNDVVIYSNLIWQCAIAHTSASTFDESKWVCISGGEISNGLEIVDLWNGDYNTSNESNNYGSFIYTQTISDSIENYDYLVITIQSSQTSEIDVNNNIFNVSDATNHKNLRCDIYATPNYFSTLSIMFVDNTTFGIAWNASVGFSVASVVKIQGIRKAKPIVSSGMKYETLWEGEAGNYSGESTITINLSEPISIYKKIGFCCIANNPANNSKKYYYREITVAEFLTFLINAESNDSFAFCWGFGSKGDTIEIKGSSRNSQLVMWFDTAKVTKIIGISEGVQIPTGVQAARVTLFEGNYSSSNQGTSFLYKQSLYDSIENYDQLEITVNGSVDGDNREYTIGIVNITDIVYNTFNTRICVDAGGTYSTLSVGFSDNNHFSICWSDHAGWSILPTITKIVGIKYIQPDSYSTEEKLIGTWIDGKPLYRKVFENPTNGMDTGINNTDYNIKKLYGGAIQSDMPSVHFDIPYFANGVGAWVFSNNGVLTIGASFSCAVQWVAIEYTKN